MDLDYLKDENGLAWILFTLTGDLAKLPSGTNRRKIGFRKDYKTGRKTPFIMKDRQITEQLELMTYEYMRTLGGKVPPSFFDKDVYCAIYCADIKYRNSRKSRPYDSHNSTKSLCDWLESIGLVSNDSQIEAHPAKIKDYPDLGEGHQTLVLVVRRDLVQGSLTAFSRILFKDVVGEGFFGDKKGTTES